MKTEQMILYEDRDIIVCRKPAGLAVQSAGVGVRDLMSLLMNYLSEKQQGIPYLGLVHRLDQPVEGILVFAKNKKAAAELSRQVTDGRMKKEYLAVCCRRKADGNVRPVSKEAAGKKIEPGAGKAQEICLTDYLKKDARTNTSSIVGPKVQGAKKSELIYRIADEREIGTITYQLVRISLRTGRHHQIRVQMAGAGQPLYGDRKYHTGWEECRLAGYEHGSGTQLALCAASLSFVHPSAGRQMTFDVQPEAGIFRLFD